MLKQRRCVVWAVAFSLAASGLSVACAVDEAAAKKREEMVVKAMDFLATKGQADDGSFNAQAGPAVTALVIAGVLRNGRSADEVVVARALKYVEGFVHEDGGVYEGEFNRNYETCIAILCFKEANRGGKYDVLLKNAEDFVKRFQFGVRPDLRAAEPNDVKFGGAGYGRNYDRPDLSNTAFFLEALKTLGEGPDSEAMQRALVFVGRCQNLAGPNNTTPFAGKINDGGFYYTPAAGGNSQAGNDERTGGLRSYASMTYAGLKSMVYAGLTKDDERVKAALAWLKKNYDVNSNPGLGNQGLYYYYMTFSKALAALGEDTFTDESGAKHDWRKELIEALATRQKADGSWINENQRWLEGDPNLSTGYALLALSYCR